MLMYQFTDFLLHLTPITKQPNSLMQFQPKSWITLFLCLLLSVSIHAQKKRLYSKESGTTIDSIYVADVKKGGTFIKVESYIQEFNKKKPAIIATYRFKEIDSEGNLIVKYSFTNKLIDFKIRTTLTLKNWEILNFVVDSSRKKPLEVVLKTHYSSPTLAVEYLN